ncbi:hypothetical protein [Alicyclobacillus shizuokensis]|uniref:hypothetical protein n=1 Tax=Alicyclobacillus shizuokensis TaxID=392014 RepID=UPI00082C3768|nr:hypothetical protein [Alicyclobacillus shizuokensis]
MRMPTSKPGGARFRGPTSSHEYNQNEDDKYLELVELYQQSNKNLQDLQEAHRIVVAENAALQAYIQMLTDRIGTLEQKITDMQGALPYPPTFFQTSFVQQMATHYPNISQDNSDSTLRADMDTEYRYATLPMIAQIPKTYVKNDLTGEIIVPDELQVSLGRSNSGGTVVDTNVYEAFNGSDDTFWERVVTYDFSSCPDQEDVIMEITLPSHLVNNLNINTIVINPHPERGVQVANVEYLYEDAWQQIPGFQQNDLATISTALYSPRKKWYFPQVPVQKIRITLVQKTPIDLGGKKAFILGAQEIGVYLTLFEQGGGMVLTPFEMTGLYNIESVEHVFLNRGAFSFDQKLDNQLEGNIFDYEILKEEIDGTLTPLSGREWSGQFAQRLWVRTMLYPDPYNGVNPCLTAVRLNYSR